MSSVLLSFSFAFIRLLQVILFFNLPLIVCNCGLLQFPYGFLDYEKLHNNLFCNSSFSYIVAQDVIINKHFQHINMFKNYILLQELKFINNPFKYEK